MLVGFVSPLYRRNYHLMRKVRNIVRIVLLGHNNLSVHSACSLLEVDGELCAILYRLDNLVVCHILNDLVNSCALKGCVAYLYELDLNCM